MVAGSPWGLSLIALLVMLAALLVPSAATGQSGQAAQGTPRPQATVQRGAGRLGQSPTLLGDMNNDGLVDIRDYGIWRQSFGAADCGNPADLDGNCLVDIRDYGIWRQNFGQTGPTATPTTLAPGPTATPTATATPLPGRAYVANAGSNSVTVIDTTTNLVVGPPITVGIDPQGVGVDPTVHRAFVANGNSANVTVIDTTTNFVGAPFPWGSVPSAWG